MFLAHKIEITLTKEQQLYFEQAFGCSRKVYNEGLALWQTLYEQGEKPTWQKVRNAIVARKKTDLFFLNEISSQVTKNACEDLGNAFKKFFSKTGKYPQFKCKGRSQDSFRIIRETESSIRFLSITEVEFDKRCGPIKLKESLRFEGLVKRVTFSKRAGRYFASFMIDVEDHTQYYEQNTSTSIVGIDLGIKDFLVSSEGEVVPKCNALIRHEAKLKKLQRNLSRKVKGSKQYNEAKTKLSKLHYRISCIREDFLHKVTTALARTYGLIKMEDLNVSGMIKNHKLAKYIAHASFYKFKTMLAYKTKLYGSNVGLVGRFFPSSKMCSCCGNVKETLLLSERTYHCDTCGNEIDRDFNAAINIERFPEEQLVLI